MRADTAGAVRGFIDGLMARNCEFSVGGRVCASLDADIAAVAPEGWVAARDANGTPLLLSARHPPATTAFGLIAGARLLLQGRAPRNGLRPGAVFEWRDGRPPQRQPGT